MKKTFLTLMFIAFSLACISQKPAVNSGRYKKTAYDLSIPPKYIDPQVVQDQDDMTWDDYNPIPGKNWADPSLEPGRKFRMALVAVDFPDQPFVITQPRHAELFGNPQIDPIQREEVPQFYSDFWLKPSEVNHGQTINGYWMEQSRGRFGITALDAFGPYRMPANLWEYGLNEWGQHDFTPDGRRPSKRMERHVDSIWTVDKGDLKSQYDAILRIYAGYDETGVWQEFGEMKFLSKDDIPPEWGNPDTTLPRWAATRYVPWTSWKAAQMQWGLSSIRQGENSGTITHELGHYAFSIGDNNNNPYVEPYRRVGSGTWDMMDRGCFNGPGGPHMRWVVPPTMGASMPAGLMLRNRMINGFLDKEQVLTLSREGLALSGPVVATVIARAVEPLPESFSGIVVRLDGFEPHDRTPADDPATNPLSPGIPNYDFYSLEVVQRIGYDSFCPDNGVLLAKNKDKESSNGGPNGFNCFNWVIDAHPEDINMVDYVRPDGQKVMRTMADYRQLNDALFHAGLNSGSIAEWADEHNRLHFYIINKAINEDGILSYELGIRSLDGSGPQKRGVSLTPPRDKKINGGGGYVLFTVSNTGEPAASDTSLHHQNTTKWLNSDIYRITAGCEGEGCSATLLNGFISLLPGEAGIVPVYISFEKGASRKTKISLTVRSESNSKIEITETLAIKKNIGGGK